jgi:hypothetical protein
MRKVMQVVEEQNGMPMDVSRTAGDLTSWAGN